MRYNDLMWRGVLASEMGVIVMEPVAYKRPELRRETVTVPGRSGTLTIKQDDAYESVVYTPALAIRPGFSNQAVYDWLRGSGRVIFGSMPDVAYDAVLTGQMDCTELIPGHPAWYETLIPTFECQPWQYPVAVYPDIVFISDADYARARWNPGNVPSVPLIRLEATPGTVIALQVSGNDEFVVTVPAVEAETVAVLLDCDAEIAYTEDGINLGTVVVGEFPRIQSGEWQLSCRAENGTINRVTVTPRWRSV